MAERILVIGLDGATFDLITPWVNEGRLPVFAKIMKEGVYGELRSTIHPLTPQAWTSFMTGKNPGKHGIFGWTKRKPGSYEIQYTNANSRDGRTLWQILSEFGLRVGVIDVPMTYPPEEVNGFIISGMDALWQEGKFTYPPELLFEIESKLGQYQWYPDRPTIKNLDAWIEKVLATIQNRTNIAKYLMRHKDWSFLITVYMAPDRAQHALWRHMDSTHPQHVPEEAEKYGHVIKQIYEKIDQSMGELLGEVGDETTVIIMSDHGAGPYKKVLNLSKWLEMNGFLCFKDRNLSGFTVSILYRQSLHSILKHLFFGLKRCLPKSLRTALSATLPSIKDKWVSHLFFSEVDWSRTRAYAMDNYGNIFINLKDREPNGIVDPTEYESTRDSIIEKLRELRDPDTGEAVLGQVYKREELYRGIYTTHAPDLIILWKDFNYYTRQTLVSEEVALFEPPGKFGGRQIEHSACHRLDGIFIAMGKEIVTGKIINGAQIIDLAPTVLYLLGLPVSTDMDGRVLKDVINSKYLEQHPVRYFDVEQTPSDSGRKKETYSSDEAKIVQQRLRDLGYIE